MVSTAIFLVWTAFGVALSLTLSFFIEGYLSEVTKSAEKNTKRSAFRATRLTPTTFLIVETDDIYAEHPFIYAKIVPSANTILLIDTGCGGASNDPDIEITSLREFLETTAVADNGGKPLNEQGRMRYVIVLSHCHYDHILGVEQFTVDSPILASAYSPSFISPINLPAHSLCKGLAVRTPTYTPILVPHQSSVFGGGAPLGVTLFHTPGHTPDELALWDEKEKMLYVGDTLYEWEHIIFPNEGNIMTWLSSLDALVALVAQSPSPNEIRINCGHRTALRPALEVLRATKQFMVDVLKGKEVAKDRMKRRGIDYLEYVQDGGRFSLICPEHLIVEARSIL